jgi:dolichol-phosphate mannosyltransferase
MGVSAYRAFISRCANIFLSVMFAFRNVKEYSCGYRAYRGEIVRRAIEAFGDGFIQLKGLGFTCTIEKLIKFNLLGARFAEVPFVLRYDQKRSASKMVTSTTTLGYFVLVLLYHWPWGGWRRGYRDLKRSSAAKPEASRPGSARSPVNS